MGLKYVIFDPLPLQTPLHSNVNVLQLKDGNLRVGWHTLHVLLLLPLTLILSHNTF